MTNKKLSALMTAVAALPLAVATGCAMPGAMTGGQKMATRITLDYTEYGLQTRKTFSLTPEVMAKALEWRAELSERSAADFSRWLHMNGGKLDRANGPAWIDTALETGRHTESWYKDGNYFRADGGPEIVEIEPDGSRRELWVGSGDFTQEVKTAPDKTQSWVYRRNGKYIAERGAGRFNIPGVTVTPPQP